MRMHDRPTVEADIFVAASDARAWELVTSLERMEQWSPEY
jgi:hypothetical protein